MTLISRSSIACGLATALALTPAGATAQQSGRSTKSNPTPASLGIHGFSVVLVVGAMQGAASPEADGVPETAKKALTDMRGFLPYKRYQLLDAAWMLCCASDNSGASGRVRGPNERDYTYSVDPIGVADSKLNLRFSMRELSVSSLERSAQGELVAFVLAEQHPERVALTRELDEAVVQHNAAKTLHAKGLITAGDLELAHQRVKTAEQRVKTRPRSVGMSRTVMDSTFSIAPGETVVVGTSRLHGDQALIAILTAAAKPGAAR